MERQKSIILPAAVLQKAAFSGPGRSGMDRWKDQRLSSAGEFTCLEVRIVTCFLFVSRWDHMAQEWLMWCQCSDAALQFPEEQRVCQTCMYVQWQGGSWRLRKLKSSWELFPDLLLGTGFAAAPDSVTAVFCARSQSDALCHWNAVVSREASDNNSYCIPVLSVFLQIIMPWRNTDYKSIGPSSLRCCIIKPEHLGHGKQRVVSIFNGPVIGCKFYMVWINSLTCKWKSGNSQCFWKYIC